MKTRMIALLSGLVLSLPATAWAQDFEPTSQFLIELSGKGPADLHGLVEAAGGAVAHDMRAIGYASAVSDDPGFAATLRRERGVRAVTRDLLAQWVPERSELPFTQMAAEDAGILAQFADPDAALFGACQWSNAQIDTQGAWASGQFGSPEVKVAVLDTGTDPFHQDLADSVDTLNSRSMLSSTTEFCETNFPGDRDLYYDFYFHGAFISGQIAGAGIGIAGVAPHAGIVGVKVLNCQGKGSFSDIAAGILYAADLPDVHVINLSLGVYMPRTLAGFGQFQGMITKALNYANARGKLVVAAAGNDGADLQHDGTMVFVPAEFGAGIAAWAGDYHGDLAGYSNHGVNQAQLGAGGGTWDFTVNLGQGCFGPPLDSAILSTCSSLVCGSTGAYIWSGGTSFSAPLVAGTAALLDGKYGGALNAGELKAALQVTADDLGKPGADNEFGLGRVNAGAAAGL